MHSVVKIVGANGETRLKPFDAFSNEYTLKKTKSNMMQSARNMAMRKKTAFGKSVKGSGQKNTKDD